MQQIKIIANKNNILILKFTNDSLFLPTLKKVKNCLK